MSKRQHQETEIIISRPNEIIVMIGEILWQEWKGEKTKKSCQPFINYACCNQLFNNLFSLQLMKLRYKTWCIMCEEKKGFIKWACHGGSHCQYYIELCDKNHDFNSGDSLCSECCLFQCDFCRDGFCRCDVDSTSCDICRRDICSRCRLDNFNYDDDICDDCFNLTQ
jgi:hypothetical protein